MIYRAPFDFPSARPASGAFCSEYRVLDSCVVPILCPQSIPVSWREWLFSCVGAFIGLMATEMIGHHSLASLNPWFVAPMGASAVLLFAVPASPLAQPWSIVGGNMVSATIGVSCAQLIAAPGMAAALAVALSIAAMMKLRCLHRLAARWR